MERPDAIEQCGVGRRAGRVHQAKQWHQYIGDPGVADAALDRIVHAAHHVTLHGESMRKARASLTTEARSAN